MYLTGTTIGGLWLELLTQLYQHGHPVSPRGKPCREFTGVTLKLENARNNIFASDVRRVSYRFMVAEWLWIWYGHNDVATITHYNSHIAQFSDNGVDFNGAYGPPIRARWPGVLNTLKTDPDSRQAVIQVYRTPEQPTKDVPCTLSMSYFIRNGQLDTVVSMRSSDVWLGLPYDTFMFTTLANILAAQLEINIGSLTLHLGSSHLYAINNETAAAVIADNNVEHITSPRFKREPPTWLDDVLTRRDPWFDPHLSPWNVYAQVLLAKTNAEALKLLKTL
jgi:thymidylate synthase